MYWEAMRTPSLPGENDVTNGSVDYYDTDWENVDNSALEEEMQKCSLTPCEGKTQCPLSILIFLLFFLLAKDCPNFPFRVK